MQAVQESISSQKKEYERLQAKAKEERSTGRNLHNHSYEEIHDPLLRHDMGEHQRSSITITGKQPNSHGNLGGDQRQYNEHHATDQGQNANQHHSTTALRLEQEADQWLQQGANQWQKHADTASSVSRKPYHSASANQWQHMALSSLSPEGENLLPNKKSSLC